MKEDKDGPHSEKWDVKKKAKELLQTGRKRIHEMELRPIWDRTKKELQGAVKIIGKKTEKATEKTISLGKQAGFQYQVYLNQLKLQKALAGLGGRIFDLTKGKSASLTLKDTKALSMIKKVQKLDIEVEGLKKKVKTAKK